MIANTRTVQQTTVREELIKNFGERTDLSLADIGGTNSAEHGFFAEKFLESHPSISRSLTINPDKGMLQKGNEKSGILIDCVENVAEKPGIKGNFDIAIMMAPELINVLSVFPDAASNLLKSEGLLIILPSRYDSERYFYETEARVRTAFEKAGFIDIQYGVKLGGVPTTPDTAKMRDRLAIIAHKNTHADWNALAKK